MAPFDFLSCWRGFQSPAPWENARETIRPGIASLASAAWHRQLGIGTTVSGLTQGLPKDTPVEVHEVGHKQDGYVP
jgi:hypothetical protein